MNSSPLYTLSHARLKAKFPKDSAQSCIDKIEAANNTESLLRCAAFCLIEISATAALADCGYGTEYQPD
jgi:hypothetical protein